VSAETPIRARLFRLARAAALALLAAACGGPAPTVAPAEALAPATTPPTAPVTAAPAVEPTLFTLPTSASPGVAIRLLFRSGSADDPADLPGLTALTAQWMAEGGTRSLTAFELKQKLYPWAASIGVEMDADMTVFTATVHRDHLAEFLPVLAEVVTAPRWEPGEFERLRRDAIDDIETRLRSSDDENLGKFTLEQMLYPNHPYGHFAGGSVAGLKAITPEAARAHAARVFGKARLTIGVAGGYPADLPEGLKSALAGLPDGQGTTPLPAPTPAPERVRIVEKDAPAVAISMGATVAFDRTDPDFTALMVGISAFGEHRQFHGRLMQRMRESRGLNYGDYAYAEHFRQEPGGTFPAVNIARRQQAFTIWVRPVQPGDAVFALRLALHEYDTLLRDGLTEAEVKTAAQFLEGYTQLWAKNPQRRLGMALDDAFYGTPERLARFRAALSGLTAAQVNGALRKHLPPLERLSIVLVAKDATGLRDALIANSPSPKKYASEKPAELLAVDAVVAVRPFGLAPEAIRIVPVGRLF
jgi:zinc protease